MLRLGGTLLAGGLVAAVVLPMIYVRTPYNQDRRFPVDQSLRVGDHRGDAGPQPLYRRRPDDLSECEPLRNQHPADGQAATEISCHEPAFVPAQPARGGDETCNPEHPSRAGHPPRAAQVPRK